MNGSFGLYSFLTGHMYSLCSVYYFIINKNQTRVLFFIIIHVDFENFIEFVGFIDTS
ncbi:hypothetical protein HanPSC8_Chr05g0212781 [Helianthus annuus]|nr:hypothetical protein HanPSC8_Chr05g0212781 [Helianthus annuus]